MSLVNTLGRMYMDIYDRDTAYPEVDALLTQLEHATPQAISLALSEVDHEQGDENTPLMYLAIFLRTSWIRRVLRIARRAEEGIPGHPGIPELRKQMFESVNSAGDPSLVLLLDGEIIYAEEENLDTIELERIRLFVEHGATPDQPIESRNVTIRQYAEQQGLEIDWDNMGGHLKKHRKSKKQTKTKPKTKPKKKSKTFKKKYTRNA